MICNLIGCEQPAYMLGQSLDEDVYACEEHVASMEARFQEKGRAYSLTRQSA